jgi:hypothetical protein
MNLDTLLITAITTDASRRGPRGSLQELTGRLGVHRTPDANDIGEWIRWIASTYGIPTARVVVILLSSHAVGLASFEELAGALFGGDGFVGPLDSRYGPMMRWIGREVNRWYNVLRKERKTGVPMSYMLGNIIDCVGRPTLSSSPVEEYSLTSSMRLQIWASPRPSTAETELDAESFRQLPSIMDWRTEIRPQLSKLDIDDAAEAAIAWHEGALESIVVPSGSVARGELVLVHPGSEVDDEDGFWTIQRLTSHNQYSDEGGFMGHCVGGHGYWGRHQNDELDIYSVRNEQGDPTLTIEILKDHDGEPRKIEQIKGSNNETPMTMIMSQGTQSGDDWEMVLDGAVALINHIESEHGVTLRRGSDANELLLYEDTGGEGIAKGIEEGDIEVDDRLGQQLAHMMGENYDDAIVSAWAKSVESGKSMAVGPTIAYEQVHLYKDRLPEGMTNLENLVYARSKLVEGYPDHIDRSGGSDDVAPWILTFEKVVGDIDARLTIKGIALVGFSTDGDYDMDSSWYLITDSEAEFISEDEFLSTPGFSSFDEDYDPFGWLLESKTFNWPNGNKNTYLSWEPDKVASPFPIRRERWKEGDLVRIDDVARLEGALKFSEIVKELEVWFEGGIIDELMGELHGWKEDVIRRAIPRLEDRWKGEAVAIEREAAPFVPGTWRPGTAGDWSATEGEPQRQLFVWKPE